MDGGTARALSLSSVATGAVAEDAWRAEPAQRRAQRADEQPAAFARGFSRGAGRVGVDSAGCGRMPRRSPRPAHPGIDQRTQWVVVVFADCRSRRAAAAADRREGGVERVDFAAGQSLQGRFGTGAPRAFQEPRQLAGLPRAIGCPVQAASAARGRGGRGVGGPTDRCSTAHSPSGRWEIDRRKIDRRKTACRKTGRDRAAGRETPGPTLCCQTARDAAPVGLTFASASFPASPCAGKTGLALSCGVRRQYAPGSATWAPLLRPYIPAGSGRPLARPDRPPY